MRKFLFFFILLMYNFSIHAYTIDIQVAPNVQSQPIVNYALDDVKNLLLQSGVGEVIFNAEKSSDVTIVLPHFNVEKSVLASDNYAVITVADRSYHWEGRIEGSSYVLNLQAHSYEGISAALYGLLQEVLDFNFYHPRASVIPDLTIWPLQNHFSYSSRPRFNKMGFHLHTQHPIELTEALLDENYPDGEQRIREYIDWLARNRQNYMEFCLLESINRKTWPAYAQKWVTYMKDRGVVPGLDLSLHMKQQYAFKLYRNLPRSFQSKDKQIKERISALTQADWKVFNMEFSETEFSSGDVHKKSLLRADIQKLLAEKDIYLFGREHVVKKDNMVGAQNREIELENDSDKDRGTMIHTVMFYTLNDTLAPVYGNKNLLHMREQLLSSRQHRETWYYPESAYWVTFDNSIPLFLTPYLNARLEDILYCDSLNIEGHLTFSSGWEWSYWLIDWSIANWSWESTINGQKVIPYPEQYFDKIQKSNSVRTFFKQVNQLQNQSLKVDNLIKYLTATTVTDEMPLGLNLPFQPIPEKSYSYMRNKASKDEIDSIHTHALSALQQFVDRYNSLKLTLITEDIKNPIFKEILNSLDITTLRVQHRIATMNYLLSYRKSKLAKDKSLINKDYLLQAKSIRLQAIKIVRERERVYKYSAQELASQRESHTSYQFGYLFPVHNLHFWEREEGQAAKNKWKFWYKNIWDIWRIIGIVEK
ncbi:MAG: hypothetical protein M9958_11055 [Chitinophagales bacterium]|nr:hypothetical protein [Chitinophagales bacterium]